MARNVVGSQALVLADAPCGGGDGDQCGLGIRGQLELVFGTLEAEAREAELQGVVGFFEDPAGKGEFVRQGFTHSGELGALSRKKECG